MRSIKLCEKCGYRHGSDRCCIDIYQQLGRTKGPSVVGKVMLAFLLPLLVFIGSLMLAGYILSGFKQEGGMKTFISFLAALVVTVVLVQLIRIFTRKPISMKNDSNKKI
jgi:hypothetical protein